MSTLPDGILATFDALFTEAQAAGEQDPTAMTVATADADGRPSARIVLLKGVKLKSAFPQGPFLVLGTLVVVVFSNQILGF